MRTCGSCGLCCKLPGVYTAPDQTPTLAKPPGQWCEHCKVGSGCQIYESRPQPCHNFDCLWLVHPEMAEELRPDRSHVIMYGLTDEDKETFHCDVVVMEDPAYFRLGESGKNHLIEKTVRTLIEAGQRVAVTNGKEGRALSRQ